MKHRLHWLSRTESNVKIRNYRSFAKKFAYLKNENVTLLDLWQNPCNVQNSTLHSDRHLTSTTNAVTVHNCLQSKIKCLSDRNVFWSKSNDSGGNSFIGLLQQYTSMSVTTLKANAIVVYPVPVAFLNFPKQFRRYLVDHVHSLVVLRSASLLEKAFEHKDAYKSINIGKLPNSFELLLCDERPVNANNDARSSKLRMLHEVMHNFLALLALTSGSRFLVTMPRTDWKRHSIVASSCCDTLEGKDMSNVNHGRTVSPLI